MPDGSAGSAPNAYQQNAAARQLVVSQSLDMIQSIANGTIAAPTNPTIINVSPRFVGLAKRFYIKIGLTITNNAAAALTLTPFGLGNLLNQVVFNDLQNNVRIQTTGWHLQTIATAKAKWAAGAAFTNDSPMFNKSGYATGIQYAPTTIAASGGTANITAIFEVPLAYTDNDLRGSVYLNTVNATANLQFTLNTTPVVASTADPTFAVYQSAGAATYTITNFTYNVYQQYLDQLPVGKSGVVLPLLDISTIYELKNTSVYGITANQDFPTQYPNYRQFLSTCAIFDNGGALNNGTDVNYWGLQAANFTYIWKLDPYMASYLSRKEIHDDMPSGGYYFSHRRSPIATQQYGNMTITLNASTVNSNAIVAFGFEDFALQNVLTQAGSFPGS
jgi:hypothetical protein